MAPAQRPCAGFRNFSGKKFMHRVRAARPRGFDSLPSRSDVGTITVLAFDEYCRFDTSAFF
jgi:hypothetical protein